MHKASLYISMWNGVVSLASVDIFNEDGDKVFDISTKVLKNRKQIEEFLNEQVRYYSYENDVEFEPEYSLLYSTVKTSDDNKLEPLDA